MNEAVTSISTAVRTQLTRHPPTEWLPDPANVTLEPVSTGAYHENFKVTSNGVTVIARYNRTSQWGLTQAEQLTREYLTLRDLRRSGAAPTPHALLLDGPVPLLIESYIDGRPFRYGPDLEPLAQAIASVHNCSPTEAHEVLPKAQPANFLLADGSAWLEKTERSVGVTLATQILRRTRNTLQQHNLRADPDTVLVHTDLIHSNLIRTRGKCMIVDWEGARIGPRAWDLAYFLSPITLRWAPPECHPLTAHDRTDFLRSYASAAGVDALQLKNDVAALMPYVIFRALAWCVGFEQTERHDPVVAQRLARFTDPKLLARHLSTGGPQ